jgi:hypothetical protein
MTTTTTDTTVEDDDRVHALLLARQEVFVQWTLPPEEAIFGLAMRRCRNDSVRITPYRSESQATGTSTSTSSTGSSTPTTSAAVVGVLATAVPPTRTTLAGAWGTSKWLNQPRTGQREELALVAWCRRHQVDPAILAAAAAATDDGPLPLAASSVWRLLLPSAPLAADGAPNASRTNL